MIEQADRVSCSRCHTPILTRSYDGKWMSRHHQRVIKIGPVAVATPMELECENHHLTAVVVEDKRAQVVDERISARYVRKAVS